MHFVLLPAGLSPRPLARLSLNMLVCMAHAADCLPWCSREGLHVVDTVNELALQILANLLLQIDGWSH
jgi:hypothetical protein